VYCTLVVVRSYTRETAKATSTGRLQLCLLWRSDGNRGKERKESKVKVKAPLANLRWLSATTSTHAV
jgi:hypothetical protein